MGVATIDTYRAFLRSVSWPCLAGRSANSKNFLTLTLSAWADAVDAVVDVCDVIIPNRYGSDRLGGGSSRYFIHPKNPQFVEELDLQSTGFL